MKLADIKFESRMRKATEDHMKKCNRLEFVQFIKGNGSVEEDEGEFTYESIEGKQVKGLTYEMNHELSGDEFFITEEGRIFFIISMNKMVEIVSDPEHDTQEYEDRIQRYSKIYGVSVKTDKNGTKYFNDYTCTRCGGHGSSDAWKFTGYTCYKCGGTGRQDDPTVTTIWTPEFTEKMVTRRIKKQFKERSEHASKIGQVRKDWLKKWGFNEEGFIFCFLGETFSKKDQIKDLGGHFNRITGWYINHEVDGFQFLKLSKDQILFETYYGYEWKYDVDVNSMKKAEEDRLNPKEHTSEYQGQLKERLRNLKLTVTFTTTFEGQSYSYYDDGVRYFYSFKDEAGNIFTYTTSNPFGQDEGKYFKELQKGDTCTLTGTVKEHKEYKGDKQTVLTRCKVQGIA